jgi:hypothetical protein
MISKTHFNYPTFSIIKSQNLFKVKLQFALAKPNSNATFSKPVGACKHTFT